MINSSDGFYPKTSHVTTQENHVHTIHANVHQQTLVCARWCFSETHLEVV